MSPAVYAREGIWEARLSAIMSSDHYDKLMRDESLFHRLDGLNRPELRYKMEAIMGDEGLRQVIWDFAKSRPYMSHLLADYFVEHLLHILPRDSLQRYMREEVQAERIGFDAKSMHSLLTQRETADSAWRAVQLCMRENDMNPAEFL